ANTSFGSFTVTVVTGPPTLTLPSDITAEATSSAGAVVTYTATADQNATVVCNPPSGSTFPLGNTTVNCTATNVLNQTTTGSFHVNVVDTTPPTLTLPSDITAEATSPAGAAVTFTATATDLVDGTVTVNCSPASGSTFALGTTPVHCTATDLHNNTASGSFNVKVQDTTPPEITSLTASPAQLWPPDHKMANVTITGTATDLVDTNPTLHIVSVTSDQPVVTNSNGDQSPDWIITGDMTVQLRSERTNGQDRTYTITVAATDFSGNTSTSTVQVKVTQFSGNHRAVGH
ncbi:MAG TPA: HYR domain-containing protein, partial [Thermoanaerobaculia bacterium]|nr:HYR domain-containing protein [Thermoanaerobaculia bacterium]